MTASNGRKYFGTDGVRGKVGTPPLTADFALKIANAAARALLPEGGKVLIGKDTRLSGYMFESALEAGFVAAGVDVALIGPLPTPGVAYMTKHLNCDLGVVISASHNGYNDNGIKFFDKNGGKLSDELEKKVETYIEEPAVTRDSQSLGRAVRVDEERVRYQEFCAGIFPKHLSIEGMKLVVDCANGAGYKVAPRVFTSLKADVLPIGTSPNGRNINDGCGATAPGLLQMMVTGASADAGIALDGDGDRLIMVDHEGKVVDGDTLVYILAMDRKRKGALKGPVVGTVMSNMGLEVALKAAGIEFFRAKVGDRNIIEMLHAHGGVLGGEPSGHIIDTEKIATGDGIIAAIKVLSVMAESKKSLKELAKGLILFPQVIVNSPLQKPMTIEEVPGLSDALTRLGKELEGQGQIVVRPSGTEPVMRIMVEHADAEIAKRHAEAISALIANAQ